ncbi:MAG: glycosyltransferase family 39 protein [Bryobacteraceae bacterium]
MQPAPEACAPRGTAFAALLSPARLMRFLTACRWDALAATALAALAIGLQFASGAYRSDFASTPDEPSHVVSSLMIRDYAAQGFPGSPVRFAANYYVHYPKVAIGHWPPLFYLIEAGWMLAFGRTRAAMLALPALFAVLLAVSVYAWLKRDCGRLAAFFAAAILVSIPLMQFIVAMVSPDILLGLLTLWAAIAYGRYRESGSWRYGALAALLGVCAILTHGRAAGIVFVPAFAALAGGRYRLNRIFWFFEALFCAAAIYLPTRFPAQGDWEGLRAASRDVWHILSRTWVVLGWPVALIAVIGVVWTFRAGRPKARWAPLLAIVFAMLAVHALIHVYWADHYLVTILPAGAALFAAGWTFLSQLASRRARTVWPVTALLVLFSCGVIANNLMHLRHKPDLQYHTWVREAPLAGKESRVSLICGGATEEGVFISEIALRDPHPEHFVLRGSKVLAHSKWSGDQYKRQFKDSQAVLAYLDQTHTGTVILLPGDTHPHVAQLTDALTGDPDRWKEIAPGRVSSGVRFFARIGPEPPGGLNIQLDVQQPFGFDPHVQYHE